MAQLGARLNGIQKVRGSSPLRSTMRLDLQGRGVVCVIIFFAGLDLPEGSAGVTQLVEYHVANVTVAGSSPVSRSNCNQHPEGVD